MKERGTNLRDYTQQELIAIVRRLKIRIRSLEASTARAKEKARQLKFDQETQSRDRHTEAPTNAFGALIRFRKKKIATLQKLIDVVGELDKDVLIGILNDYRNIKSGYGVVEHAVDSDGPGSTIMGVRRTGL